ncbi:ABC transporter substrate-binding protein [Mycolicibacterium goodii]|uniref:ABC transporter substrate-binding protein n=1 Tax=Mycolicibacterium goodii TaxID=134601 RepID=A0ABS6HIK6_MYCGD|nr:ABC transporter substrate-binding protein [Mycolicibacterium goodii]MBU8822497.1 ABC transporter substrate-binding protein [Mycolicibacterium goodii]MBU8835230.1 ABC transporter substrate-binding protein [Mycolicibacterium goodii]
MSRLELTFACGDYDRTRALEDGSVRPDGIELTYLRLPVEETFFRMLRHREFDVAEMSLSTYVATLDVEPRPFVALPVYTSRMFRHGGIYINADAGIRAPSDLVGKRIGAPEFQLTAGVWIRGILDEHHGVPIDSVTYYTGGQETPGRIEKGKVDTGLDIRPIPDGATLSQMLADGEIDALHTPRVPSTFRGGDPRVKRLFPDVVTVEKEYFAATGIFPIMHVVVIRSDIYDRHPWVAQSLYKAFLTARDDAYARIYDSSALRFMEPWLIQHLEDAKQLLGQDYWSYGLAENHTTLDVFLRYHHEQGLSRRRYEPADLFARETAESFVI